MSEQTTEKTDKELNFERLREKNEALEARNAELEPLAVARLVAEAGFAPDTPAGKALSRLTPSEADVETVRNLAAELGFEVEEPTPQLTKEERAAQEFANRSSALNSVTTSDTPPTFDDQVNELNGLIAVAKAAGNQFEVRRLNTQLVSLNNRLLAQQMAVKARG